MRARASLVAAAGYQSAMFFTPADWAAPSGIILSGVMVPAMGAPTGATTDSASGPMIATSVFPIYVNTDVLRNLVVVDADFDGYYPTIDDALPAANLDGYSHMPLNFAENTAYLPGISGSYTFHVTVSDATGSGWDVTIPFTIL